MKIIDINGKEREVEDVRLVEQNGRKWVRASIVSQNGRSHYEWYPVEDYNNRNPEQSLS